MAKINVNFFGKSLVSVIRIWDYILILLRCSTVRGPRNKWIFTLIIHTLGRFPGSSIQDRSDKWEIKFYFVSAWMSMPFTNVGLFSENIGGPSKGPQGLFFHTLQISEAYAFWQTTRYRDTFHVTWIYDHVWEERRIWALGYPGTVYPMIFGEGKQVLQRKARRPACSGEGLWLTKEDKSWE